MPDVSDLRSTIIPKSDQLNAEQLMAGDMTITVTDVRIGSDDQPVVIHYTGDDGRPFKPCKTCRKVLIFAWGEDGRKWVGKSMTLFNDPNVKFGGMSVGGIRISHLSDIQRELTVSLTATKGKKTPHTIKVLKASKPAAPKNAETLDTIRLRIESDDVAGAADVLATMDDAARDAIWAQLSESEIDALTAAWPA